MKNIMKKIVSTLVILVIAVCVSSCKSCKGEKYQYPSVVPTLSNPQATYVTIDNYTVTNEMIYYRLLQSYGVTALTTLVEKVTLQDTSVNEEKYAEYLTEYIYGTTDLDSLTQEEKDEALEAFKGTVILVSHEPEFYRSIATRIINAEEYTLKVL